MKYIETLHEGDRISEIYLCKNKVNAKTKMGKSYYSLVLQDKTGTLDGKIWELGNAIHHFEAMDYIQVDGDVTSFQGSLQMNIRRVRVAQDGEYNAADYLPVSPFPVEDMYRKLMGFVKSIESDKLRELAESFFGDDAFARRFKSHSAAKSVHHSFVGGLLQHTLRVTEPVSYTHLDVYKRQAVDDAHLRQMGEIGVVQIFIQLRKRFVDGLPNQVQLRADRSGFRHLDGSGPAVILLPAHGNSVVRKQFQIGDVDL